MNPRLIFASAAFVFASLPLAAYAAEELPPTYRGEPSAYPIELEPHFAFGAANVYGNTGYGAGLRLSVPIVTSLLERIPDNLAISFGADFIHYDNCYFGSHCGADYFMMPAAAQWNVFVARKVSVFGEGGAFVYKGFLNQCGPGDVGCAAPSDFGVLPTIAVGARVHVADNASFVARLGYPTITFGASWL